MKNVYFATEMMKIAAVNWKTVGMRAAEMAVPAVPGAALGYAASRSGKSRKEPRGEEEIAGALTGAGTGALLGLLGSMGIRKGLHARDVNRFLESTADLPGAPKEILDVPVKGRAEAIERAARLVDADDYRQTQHYGDLLKERSPYKSQAELNVARADLEKQLKSLMAEEHSYGSQSSDWATKELQRVHDLDAAKARLREIPDLIDMHTGEISNAESILKAQPGMPPAQQLKLTTKIDKHKIEISKLKAEIPAVEAERNKLQDLADLHRASAGDVRASLESVRRDKADVQKTLHDLVQAERHASGGSRQYSVQKRKSLEELGEAHKKMVEAQRGKSHEEISKKFYGLF